MDEKIVKQAMDIILYAGDARNACKVALDAIADEDYETAKEKMKEAKSLITEAHRIQTDAIQKDVAGEKQEYNLLFSHAQDTLMTIYSEINITKQLLKIFEKQSERKNEKE